MLFPYEPFGLKIHTVLELEWESACRVSSDRPFHALSFRTKGGADFTYNGKTVRTEKNEILFVPQDTKYEMKHTNEHLYVVHFTTETPMPCDMYVLHPHNPLYICDIFSRMHSKWVSSKPDDRYDAYSLMYKLLSELCVISGSDNNKDRHIKNITEYIHSHFRESDLGVSALSEVFGTSETYFRRAFTKAFGMPPAKYIGNLRLNYAMELLSSGYYTVEKVAQMSGFNDAKYFSRFVKIRTGYSPSYWLGSDRA